MEKTGDLYPRRGIFVILTLLPFLVMVVGVLRLFYLTILSIFSNQLAFSPFLFNYSGVFTIALEALALFLRSCLFSILLIVLGLSLLVPYAR